MKKVVDILKAGFVYYSKFNSRFVKGIKMTPEPFRNVEIKAKLNNKANWEKKLKIAKEITGAEAEIIQQNDVFFHSKNGRLKLRYLVHKKSELIFYDRPDEEGPKLSEFHKVDTDEPEVLEQILEKSIGIKGKVQKQRFLFIYENTRIHLDDVQNLGYFLEFEAVLSPDETVESGQKRLEKLLEIFEIPNSDLLQGAYMDKLMS